MKQVIVAGALALSLTACSTIIKGTSQDISVNTNPAGADCVLNRNDAKIAEVNPTPGSAKVDKTKDNIKLVCSKAGYQDATFIARSGFETAGIGNVFLSGLIGFGVDSATGADNHYESPINVTLLPVAAQAPAATNNASNAAPVSSTR